MTPAEAAERERLVADLDDLRMLYSQERELRHLEMADNVRLQAEVESLIPLARLGLGGLDGGSYYLDALVRVGVSKPNGEETPETISARALLAAYASFDAAHKGEG